MVSLLQNGARMALASLAGLAAMTPVRHFIAPRRPAGVAKDAAPGAGAKRARARLRAEREATARRLANAAPPKITRQQLRAMAHADGFLHRQWRAAFDLEA